MLRRAFTRLGYQPDLSLHTTRRVHTEKNNLSFIETSALDSTNVEAAFQQILTEIYRIVSQKQIHNVADDNTGPTIGVTLPPMNSDGRETKKPCCQS